MRVPQYYSWEFKTIVETGAGCRTFAPARFMEMGSRRVVMITDRGLVDAGVADQVKDVFDAQDTPLIGVYDKVEQDAGSLNINDCARWYREMAADGILAVGGGSVLDAAKSIKVMIGQKVTDIKELMAGNLGIFNRPLAKPLGVPHVSIPTTAGTGAEVSPGAVIYNEAEKVKGMLAHPYMNSDYALLDPDLTVGLPPGLTAQTGFDALSHCMEAYFSPNANSMADALALQGCRLIHQFLPEAVCDGNNLEARTELLAASCIGIAAFFMAVGAIPIHNMAHAVGGTCRIPHGEANAVFIPVVMKNLSPFYQPRAKSFAHAMGFHIDGLSETEILGLVIDEIVALQKKTGINPKFSLEIDAASLGNIHSAVKLDPAGLYFPIPDQVIAVCLKESFVVK